MKKIKKISIILLTIFTIIVSFKINAYANSGDMVYLGGENIGIKLTTGVTVIGKYEVETEHGKIKPWKDSNIEVNDVIVAMNNLKITDNNSLLNVLSNIIDDQIQLELMRNNEKIITTIQVATTNTNHKSLGLYIKDKILGVGTLTFIDKSTNRFAALGHGIYHDNQLYLNAKGVILDSDVESIKKATPGDAGEIRSNLNNQVIGYIYNNQNTGLYGKDIQKNTNRELIEVAEIDEVHPGKDYIITTLTSNQKEKYEIEIIEVKNQKTKDIKGIKIKIVDPRLLNITGGIIQGMSGSPIIQNNKLVGAVSHVVVDNPTLGYGIYAKWMLNDANNR